MPNENGVSYALVIRMNNSLFGNSRGSQPIADICDSLFGRSKHVMDFIGSPKLAIVRRIRMRTVEM
jgi:hypothetical protein